MFGVSRPSFWLASVIAAAGAFLGGCEQPAQIATAQTHCLAAPAGTISVFQLAGRLRLRIEQSSLALATLCDDHNRVRIFSGQQGRASVNGRTVETGQPVVVVGGVLFVPRSMERGIRSALRGGPAFRPDWPRPGTRHGDSRVVIDPGHGGKDPGAIGINGVTEKSVNLSVATRVTALLRRRGVDARMTRTDDTFVKLNDRADLANRLQCRLFVSIHANSFTKNRAVRGFDVFVAKSASSDSIAAAGAIAKRLVRLGVPEHGAQPKHADFRVLVRTSCPAVLVEMGFLSNRTEAAKLSAPHYRRRLAAAIAGGVMDFLNQ